MTALQTPASDAPAEEWGAFAVTIPDWRWPDSCPLPGFYRKSPDASWRRVENIEDHPLAIGCADDMAEGECIPDPDHWAWEGWMRRMLGNHQDSIMVLPNSKGLVEWHDGNDWDAQSLPMGRACIAAAAALGRWPGGEL